MPIANAIGAMIRRDIAPEHIVAHAQALESHLDELWIVEDLPFAGGITQMAALLQATTMVTLGHGIAPAPFRNATALAMEWAALERMYPGRVACGIGHGVQSWMRQLGEQVDSPLALIGETCQAVRTLLAGDELTTTGRYVTAEEVTLEFPPATAPFVSLGVVGPRSLELSGEVADGTVLCEAHGPVEIAAARAKIAVGQNRRSPGREHRITVFAAFHVGDEADIVRNPEAPVGWEAVSPNPAEVAGALVTLYKAGAHAVVLVPLATDPIAALDNAMDTVVPRVRAALA